MVTKESLPDVLEGLVDRHGLGAVLTALGEMCSLKAEHVGHAWQDAIMARQWDRAQRVLDSAAARVHKLGL